MTCEIGGRIRMAVVAAFAVAISLPAIAQSLDPNQLVARIVDSEGAPVSNYPVVIQQISDSTLKLYEETDKYSIQPDDWTAVVATDENGILVLPELPPGGTYAIVPVTDPKPYVTISAPPQTRGIIAQIWSPDKTDPGAKKRTTLDPAEISRITSAPNIDLSTYPTNKAIELQLTD